MVSSLALRYAGYGAVRAYRHRTKLKWGLRAARGAGIAWRNRGAISSGYKRARGMIRGRAKKRRRRNVGGEQVGTSTTKKYFIDAGVGLGSLDTRTAYIEDLTILPKQGVNDEINLRDRDVANIRGVKFCWELQNQALTVLYFIGS